MLPRRFLQVGWDSFAWLVGSLAAVEVRFDFQATAQQLLAPLGLICMLIGLQLTIGFALQLYRGRYKIGSIDEISGITFTVALVSIVGTLLVIVLQPSNVPRSLPVLAGVLAMGIMMSGRVALRVYRIRKWGAGDGTRTIIIGAGEVGEQLLRLMQADPARTFTPIGLLDDDPEVQRLRTYGIKVLGTSEDLERVVETTGARVVVIALPDIAAERLRRLDRRCRVLGVDLRIVPTGNRLLPEALSIHDINAVTVEDVLGRQPVQVDERGIDSMIRGRRILVTGAGGSIGSELVRQIHRYDPEFLGILDRDESGIQEVQLSLDGRGLLDSDALILADLRDESRLREVFAFTRPEIVFHAAALKHLPMLERYPDEAWKTNVAGTGMLLRASCEARVEAFVNISTDKAADPSSVLGLSKRVTERLTTGVGRQMDSRYLSVRFGNVLGSRGSVLNTFKHQIAQGGPVTVTHPEATRYFMTIPEAVHLVLQAAAIGKPGETLILDMGDPVSIAAVAQQLIDASGRDVDIAYVGLRPGEKLHEELVSPSESGASTMHPRITSVQVEPLTLDALDPAPSGREATLDRLRELGAG